MKILGIDYGRKKIGIAVGISGFSEPLKVIRVLGFDDAVSKVKKEIGSEAADKVIVGVSEGAMGEESARFASAVGSQLPIKVETFDETLTSKDAQNLSIQAGVSRTKRRVLEDAYAASVMLQNYLDSIKA